MSDMKCPFCNKQLQPTLRQSDEYWCENYDCPETSIKWVGSQKLWQELIRTRKALELATDTLCWYDNNCDYVEARNTLDEIKTALEQKEQK